MKQRKGVDRVKITIEGDATELAALVVGLQERQSLSVRLSARGAEIWPGSVIRTETPAETL